MTTEATVSVIIPCYRSAGTLARAVASVAVQNPLPLEVILVDDASPDDGQTRRMMEQLRTQYQAQFPTICLYLSTNAGPSGARNAGWEVAQGTYLAFLDADDTWHSRKLAYQLGYLTQHPDVVLLGGRCWVNDERNQLDQETGTIQEKLITLRQLLLKNYYSTPTVMLKRTLPCRFPTDRRHSEDYKLWLDLAARGYPMVVSTFPAAYVHKAMYGASGLSGQLAAMEKAELMNFSELRREGKLSIPTWVIVSTFSCIKYLIRLLKIRRSV